MADILERHLNAVLATIEQICHACKGAPVAIMATEIVTAYLGVKLRDPEQSRSLYLVANERGGPKLVLDFQKRIVSAISEMLKTASDGPISSSQVASTTFYMPWPGRRWRH